MADSLKTLTRAFSSLFRAMRVAADGGKQRYGDWVYKIAGKIAPAISSIHAESLATFRGKAVKDEVLGLGNQRALETARSICDTTTTWIQEGRDDDFIFGDARAAQCAVTEASYAINTAKMVACRQRGKKIRWRLGGKACGRCKKLNGKTIAPGKQFSASDGTTVFGPPLHPHCMCRLVEV